MDQTSETLVVGVRFSKVGKIYDFESNGLTDLKVGDQVVVETSRGWQLGEVAQILQDAEAPPEGWKAIDRRATPRDLLLRQMWQQQEADVIAIAKAKAVDLRLQGIKIVGAEYSFDGGRLTILFSSETEDKYELKSLRQDMQKAFGPSQVEMRQIGPRDVAKMMCGMGACGLEKRCCCAFLTDFSSISIRMAKEQGISLTPTEITGMCGRLRCCLIYEYETYVDARLTLPKRNKRVRTPKGEGKVVDNSPLRGTVRVDLPEIGYTEFHLSEIVVLDENGQPMNASTAGRPAMEPVEAIDVDHSGPEDGFTGKKPEPRPAMPKDERGNREEVIDLDSAPRVDYGPNEVRPRSSDRAQRGNRGNRNASQERGRRQKSSDQGQENRQGGGPARSQSDPARGADSDAARPTGDQRRDVNKPSSTDGASRDPNASQQRGSARRGSRRPDRSQGRTTQTGGGNAGEQGAPGSDTQSQPPRTTGPGAPTGQGQRRPNRDPKGQSSNSGRDNQQRKGREHGSSRSEPTEPGDNAEK